MNLFAQGYGAGPYGSGKYGIGATPTSLPSSNNSFSQAGAPNCNDQSPGANGPKIYGAISSGKALKVSFTKGDSPITGYVIEYGESSKTYKYSAIIKDTTSQTYTIKSLKSNTTYYLRIRSDNGCATGIWSSEFVAKTGSGSNNFDMNIDTQKEQEAPQNSETGRENESNQSSNDNSETSFKEDIDSPYQLTVKVKDERGEPVSKAEVTLHSEPRSEITDEAGSAEFKDVESGQHVLAVVFEDYVGEENITIEGSVKNIVVTIQIKKKTSWIQYGMYFGGGILAAIIGLVFIKRIRKTRH